MKAQYRCQNENRAQLVEKSTKLNGIDYLEVASDDQKTLDLHFLHPLPGEPGGVPATPALTRKNFLLTGGVRFRDIQIRSVTANGKVLTLKVDQAGDFSTYSLQLVRSATDTVVPKSFDPQLAGIEFSFKAGCPSDFDCRSVRECPPERHVEPDLDYLAKDYASFRRLMFDRLSLLAPDWRERHAADAHVTVVELLAYVADQLSYYQDAVATEAYLGTARKRISVRRHARLLDYFTHEGCNARTWLFLEASATVPVAQGRAFATRGKLPPAGGSDAALLFETMHDVTLQADHNRILLHTWSDTECCLPRGATRATLVNKPSLSLQPGNLLLFEEVCGPKTGNEADADPRHRQVVRLTKATPGIDPLRKVPIFAIEWDQADALTFPLCLTAQVEDALGQRQLKDISVARGNIVLADHGQTVVSEDLGTTPAQGSFRPTLKAAPLTHQGRARDEFGRLVLQQDRPVAFDSEAPASAAMRWEMRDALPVVVLKEDNGRQWHANRDLLGADRFLPAFVAEVDEVGRAQLRFGDDLLGRRPAGQFTATYRVGNGNIGNVGAESIARAVEAIPEVTAVRNPLPAQGGLDPEPLEEIRQFAPQAFRVQERAVTEADWAEVAERHPEVQKAAARFRWTGSWTTVFVTIDRRGGRDVDLDFIKKMRTHLERYRIAGYDLEVRRPVLVPLDLMMLVCMRPGYFRSEVKKTLLAVFSNRDLANGQRGFFHPDNFTFGQAVYLSQLYRVAMETPGVASVVVRRFQRWGKVPNNELEDGRLVPAALEIVQLDNDPNFPEHGRLEFDIQGGI